MNPCLSYFQIMRLFLSSTLLMICNYMKPTMKTISISEKIYLTNCAWQSPNTCLELFAELTNVKNQCIWFLAQFSTWIMLDTKNTEHCTSCYEKSPAMSLKPWSGDNQPLWLLDLVNPQINKRKIKSVYLSHLYKLVNKSHPQKMLRRLHRNVK